MAQCSYCGKEIEKENEGKFVAFDLQQGYEEKHFCSAEDLKSWMTSKIIWMGLSLVLGLIIAVLALPEMGVVALTFFFLPYMIRQVRHSLGSIFDGGSAGEFFAFAIILLGTFTVVYPAYKLYQEIIQYVRLKNRYSF